MRLLYHREFRLFLITFFKGHRFEITEVVS